MTKPKTAPRARYALEVKQEAVRLVEGVMTQRFLHRSGR